MPEHVRFDRAEVRVVERQLLVDDRPVPIGGRAFDVLLELLLRRDRVVFKGELLDRVWAGLVVEENNLPTQISTLRKWLGPAAITTIPGRGYRFTARLLADTVDEADLGSRQGATDAGALPTPRPTASRRTALPTSTAPLIGRAADIDALRDLVSGHAVVTVIGAGGVGKTRLVEAFASECLRESRFRHGVCWLSLAPVANPAALPGAIADALGLALGSGDPLRALRESLAPLSLLLVLDNAEHLLEAVAHTIDAIRDAESQVRLVVTSQAPLQLRDEHVYRLRGLQVPPAAASIDAARRSGAIALFVERATAANSRFVLKDDDVAVAVDVCRALDGLALAIELAAARVRLFGVRGLLEALGERLPLLSHAAERVVPGRQRTLRAALEWSHGLLSEAEQTVFRRFAVVPATASIDTLLALLADADTDRWQVLDALSGLVDRSLVDLVDEDARGTGEPRYRLLESPRSFALERLVAAGEADALRARHARVVAAAFDRACATRSDGSERVEHWQLLMRPDVDSGRAAFAWACEHRDAAVALTIGSTLLPALSWSLHPERVAIAVKMQAWLSDAALPASLRLRAALSACSVAIGSRADDMRAVALRAVELARGLDEPRQLYAALSYLGCSQARLGDAAAAESTLAELRALEDPAWPPQVLALGADAEYLAGRTDPDRALALSRRQMKLNREAGGNSWTALLNLIDAELVAGNAEEAAAYGDELMEQLRDSRDERSMAYARLNLTSVWLALKDSARSRAMAEPGWAIGPRFDLQAYWGDVLALLAAREGRMKQAARLLGYSDERYRRHQDVRQGNEEKAYLEAFNAVSTALGSKTVERLRADGTALTDADVATHAFALVDR